MDPLSLPDGIDYERRDARDLETGTFGPGTLLIAVMGADRFDQAGSLDTLAAIRRLGAGGRFALGVGGTLDRETWQNLVIASRCSTVESSKSIRWAAGLQAVVLGVRDGDPATIS